MPCPLVGSVFPLEVILFIEKVFVHLDIRRANFSAVRTNSHMQTVLYQECKAYVCLEVFENAVFFSF